MQLNRFEKLAVRLDMPYIVDSSGRLVIFFDSVVEIIEFPSFQFFPALQAYSRSINGKWVATCTNLILFQQESRKCLMFELPVDFMLDSNIELYPPSITSIDGEDGRRTFLYKSKSGNCGIFFVDGDKLTYVDRMIDAAIFNGWESNSILYCAGMTLRDRSDTGFGKPTIFCFDEQQGTAEQYEFPLEYDGRLSAAIEQQCKDLMLEKPALVPEAWVASASLKNNRLLVLALNEKAGGWFAEDPDPFVLHSDHIAIALYKFSESREIEFIAAFVPFLFWDKVETEDYIYFYMHRHRGGERPVNEMTYVEMDKASEEIKVGKVSIDNLSPVDILLTFRADYQNGFGFFAAADVVRLTFSGKVTIYLRSDNGKDWIAQQSRQ